MNSRGADVAFNSGKCSIKLDDEVIAVGNVYQNIYKLATIGTSLSSRKVNYAQLIHHRFRDVNNATSKTMVDMKVIEGISANGIKSEEEIETFNIESENEKENSNNNVFVDSDEEELVDKQTKEEDDQHSKSIDKTPLENPGLESGEEQQSAFDDESVSNKDFEQQFDIQ